MIDFKRFTAVLLAVLMLCSVAFVGVYAADGDESGETDPDAHVPGWYVVGSGEFFGVNWVDDIPQASAKMELEKGVYTVTYTNAPTGTFEFKVVETSSIGAVLEWHPDNVGNNSKFTVTEEGSTVRFCLVPQSSNSNDKPYAEVFAPGEDIPEITEPTTEPPVTVPPETAPEGNIRVNVSSNISSETIGNNYDTTLDSTVTVNYSLQSAELIANAQGYLSYDQSMLQLQSMTLSDKFLKPVYNLDTPGKATFNNTDVDNYADFKTSDTFLTATFKILNTGNTDVKLTVEELNSLDENDDAVAIVTDGGVVDASKVSASVEMSTPTQPQSSESESSEVTDPSSDPTPTQPATKAPSLSITKKTLKAGATCTIKVKNSTAKASYSSNKKTVAAVSSSGKVTALKKGSATITVKVAGKKLTCKITVSSNPTAKVGKKALKSSWYQIKKGKKLTVTLTGKAAAINNVYKSSKARIAKVISGKKATKVVIKGLKKGKATITIKVNKVKTFTIKVNVK